MPRGRTKRIYPIQMVRPLTCLYNAGLSQWEVARVLGFGIKSVQILMVNHGIARRPRIKRDQQAGRNHSWKGDNATYAALHYRVYALRGQPSHCEECGAEDPTKTYEWANLTGNYADENDYRRMCRSCHHRYDHTEKNLGAYAVRKEVPAL